MQIHFATLDTCAEARGTVVVIDVIRAMTTAAYGFAAGVRDVVPAGTVEEALVLRERFPGALVMGEVGGLPVPGFDFGNSPAALIGRDLRGKRLIQRTSAGTQGLVRSARADLLLGGNIVCAAATARYIKAQGATAVTLVKTGTDDEDQACAEYLAALLREERPPVAALLARIHDAGLTRMSDTGFGGNFTKAERVEFVADLCCCTALDRFDFVLRVERRADLLVMAPVPLVMR
jgi:2-phosphosulfolactate phosphatase